jgi:predicted Fe-Mo cluster-binding NifX family protein
MAMEFIPNPNKDANEGAGPASVQLIASKGVKKVISGEFGIKIKSLLDSLKIQMIVIQDREKTLNDVLDLLVRNENIKTK